MYYGENSPSPYQNDPSLTEQRERPERRLPRFRAALIGFIVGVTGFAVAEGASGEIDTFTSIGTTIRHIESGDWKGSAAGTDEGVPAGEEAAGEGGQQTDTSAEGAGNDSGAVPEPDTTAVQPEKISQSSTEAKTILAVGDICKPGCQTMGGIVKKQMGSSEGLDNFLVLGDSQYETGDYGAYMAYYNKALGDKAIKDITLPTIGNHEMKSGGNGYYKYFYGGKYTPYHAHQIGSWLVVAVNSEIARGPGSPQAKWLEKTLEESNAKCKLVYQHKPRFSVGMHGSDPTMGTLVNIMYNGGVDVELAGHDHNYQRYKPLTPGGKVQADGIRSWVVGTGGAEVYGLGNSSALDTKFNGVTGGLKMTLKDGSYHTEFVGANGTRDGFDGTCDNDR